MGAELCFVSEFVEDCGGGDSTYRIEPLLCTLSTLPNRALLEREVAESIRLPVVDNLELLLSAVKFGVL